MLALFDNWARGLIFPVLRQELYTRRSGECVTPTSQEGKASRCSQSLFSLISENTARKNLFFSIGNKRLFLSILYNQRYLPSCAKDNKIKIQKDFTPYSCLVNFSKDTQKKRTLFLTPPNSSQLLPTLLPTPPNSSASC